MKTISRIFLSFLAVSSAMAAICSCNKESHIRIVTEDAYEITISSAVLSARIAGISGLTDKDVELYFLYRSQDAADGERVEAEYHEDGTFTAQIAGIQRSTTYHFLAHGTVCGVEYESDEKSFTTLSPSCPAGAVDLGLSVCWASCNLGASKPEDYGGYYQWAGLEDVSSTSIYLDYSNCPYHTGSDFRSGWTKYIPSDKPQYWTGTGSPDNKTVLDPDDDVAHVKLGGTWRMPTKAEWDELKDTTNCSWTLATINGTDGYKIQSEKPGYTDNWIFLPNAGNRAKDLLRSAGVTGYYWYSSLNLVIPDSAYILTTFSDAVIMYNGDRCFGLSVRPVSE